MSDQVSKLDFPHRTSHKRGNKSGDNPNKQ